MARRVLPLIAALSTFTACSMGPSMLQTTHAGYNGAVQKVIEEELLLNIVRMRYLDSPVFLQISSISATFRFSASVGGSYGKDEGSTTALTAPGVSWERFTR